MTVPSDTEIDEARLVISDLRARLSAAEQALRQIAMNDEFTTLLDNPEIARAALAGREQTQ